MGLEVYPSTSIGIMQKDKCNEMKKGDVMEDKVNASSSPSDRVGSSHLMEDCEQCPEMLCTTDSPFACSLLCMNAVVDATDVSGGDAP